MNRGRVISGTFKRRIIKTPKSRATRPTSDVIKESIFNVLLHRFSIDFTKTGVIDVFAGSGALGIEAISLGSSNALFIDNDFNAIRCIEENIASLGISDMTKIFPKNANCIGKTIIDTLFKTQENMLVFMDPPYNNKELLLSTVQLFCTIFEVPRNVMFVIETDEDLDMENLQVLHRTRHGGTIVLYCKIKVDEHH